jgi:hypothetical protein
VEAVGADIICLLLHPPTHSSIFLLSLAHALQKKRIPVHIAISIVMPKYDQIDVGYCNTCERIGEDDACESRRKFKGKDPVLL